MITKPARTTKNTSVKRNLILAAGVLVVVIFLGVGGVYYYQMKKPERILREALTQSFLLENQSRTVTFEFEDTKGLYKAKVIIERARTYESYESPALVSVATLGQEVELPATIRYVDGQYFLKLSDANMQLNTIKTGESQLAPYVAYLEDVIIPLQNKWVAIDVYSNEPLSTQCQQEIGDIGLTDADSLAVEQAARESKILQDVKLISKQGNEYRYGLSLQNVNLRNFIEQVFNTTSIKNISDDCKQALEKSYREMFLGGDRDSTYNLELLVDADSKVITKIISVDKNTKRSVTFSNFATSNRTESVAKPTDVTELSQVLKQIPFLQLVK